MKQYELLVVLPGTMEESAVPGMIGEVKAIVEKHGGENIDMHDRGKSRLAYPIKHIRYGYFHLIRFTAGGDAIPKMQQDLSLMRELLRAIITTYNPEERADTQKKLGRNEQGPMKTLASVFERFGGESAEKKASDDADAEKKAGLPKEEKNDAPETSDDSSAQESTEKESEEAPAKLEDIDKKLDQLLEDDLKQV